MSLEPGIVCGECDLLNPVGQGDCSGCGNSLSLSAAASQESESAHPLSDSEQPVEETEAPPAVAASGEEEESMQQAQHYVCKSCYSPVPSGHKFCGKCGTPLAESVATGDPEYFGEMQVPGKAKLILIKGEGMDGVSYHLNSTDHVAGRTEGAILFGDDHWLSPRHANFYYADGVLQVRDEDSANGIFLCMHDESHVLESGDVFMAGEQMFRVEDVPPYDDTPEADGTYFFASPRESSSFRVIQVLEGGGDGIVVQSIQEEMNVGREGCDMNFPNDPYISGKHVKVARTDGRLVLVDRGSKNGTYVRVNGEAALTHGDYIFLGRQLLRVEITN